MSALLIIDKINDRKVLRKILNLIAALEDATSLNEITHLKKIEGHDSFYRIKIGNYRLGLEKLSSNEISLIRFLHRKEIYRYFPRK